MGLKEGMTNQPTDETNDVFLKLSGELRIATFNCKGANHISAREKIVHMMKTHKLDILFLQETHINTNTAEIHDQYCFVFSTNITDKQREDADKIRELSGQRKGKGKHNGKNSLQLYNLDAEKLGTAVIYHKRLERSKLDVVQHDNRNITLSLKSKGGVMNITGTHAPHSAKSTLEKTQYYQTLGRICNTYGNHNQHFILGDFNAKLSKRLPEEMEHIGPHIFNPDNRDIHEVPEAQLENRELFVEFCLEHDYVVASTWFQKSVHELVTFRNTNASTFGPPFTNAKFSQIDFVLVKKQWRNAVKDINSVQHTSLESDHKMLTASICIRLAKQAEKRQQKVPQYRIPSDDQLKNYNDRIRQTHAERLQQHSDTPLANLADCMQKIAKQTLTMISTNQRREYISAHTWNLLQSRREAQELGNYQKASELITKIKQEVRKDKEAFLKQQLEEIEGNTYKWTGIKRMRSRPNLKFTKFKDKDGNRIARSQYPQKAAEYLAYEQWIGRSDSLPAPKQNPQCLTNGKFPINDTDFTMEELILVIEKQGNNKTPGTDNLRAELVKYLDSENKGILLRYINQSFSSGELEVSLHEASVVSIYKKGDSSKLENYRPISLLQTFYKIIASLIKNRLKEGLENWIMNTQYGFRTGRSTSHAIFLARRLQSFAEITGKNLALVMLDWEKAFDKIDHGRLLESLARLEVPPRLFKIIKHIYTHPKFRVSCDEGKSDFFFQQSGIRQGCPLSPYLFILVMSVMFADIKSRLNTHKQREPIPGILFSEILFADDTLIFGEHTASLNKLLKEIELESEYYNMNLNYQKCINLTTNRKMSTIKYQSGNIVPRKQQAVYLGTILTDTVNHAAEIQNRIAMAIKTCAQLKLFWDRADTSISWKLRVFNSIVKSKLMYGLETIQLTQGEQNKIDAFQMKRIRRILKIPPTFIDRSQTNQAVRDQAMRYGVNIEKFSETWRQQKLKLLGHILRANREDPLRQVLFECGSNIPRIFHVKRCGRPKLDCFSESIKEAMHTLGWEAPSEITQQDLNTVIRAANNRQGPF